MLPNLSNLKKSFSHWDLLHRWRCGQGIIHLAAIANEKSINRLFCASPFLFIRADIHHSDSLLYLTSPYIGRFICPGQKFDYQIIHVQHFKKSTTPNVSHHSFWNENSLFPVRVEYTQESCLFSFPELTHESPSLWIKWFGKYHATYRRFYYFILYEDS